MSEMDAIDRKQQEEIEALRSVNERQDSYIGNIIWAFLIFAVIQFSTTIMFMYSLNRDCPHTDCPHAAHAE